MDLNDYLKADWRLQFMADKEWVWAHLTRVDNHLFADIFVGNGHDMLEAMDSLCGKLREAGRKP